MCFHWVENIGFILNTIFCGGSILLDFFNLMAMCPKHTQGCIFLTCLSVISSKFIQKFAQKCQYFTLIDQSVPLYNFYITFYLRTNQLWLLLSFFQKQVLRRPQNVKTTTIVLTLLLSSAAHRLEHVQFWIPTYFNIC